MSAFLKFGVEMVGGPLVSSLLFLAVFHVALAGRAEPVPGATITEFVAPGLVLFAMAHTAFDAAAFPILHDKLEGMIQDILMAPLTPLEMLAGYIAAAASAGIMNAAIILAAFYAILPLPMDSLLQAAIFAALGAAFFAVVGALVGLWADKWEHYSAAETFLILPLGLLSGTFFSITAVPSVGQHLLRANPVFYAIDGFRAGVIGRSESDHLLGATVLVVLTLAIGLVLWRLTVRGYKLKA